MPEQHEWTLWRCPGCGAIDSAGPPEMHYGPPSTACEQPSERITVVRKPVIDPEDVAVVRELARRVYLRVSPKVAPAEDVAALDRILDAIDPEGGEQ